MKRRDLLQAILLTSGTAVSVTPARAVDRPANYDASKELARPDWKPSFLDDHQNETLIVLSDLIVPDSDTPGAKAALVNRFLDQLLSSESEATQRSFLASLAYLDGGSIRRYGSAFLYLPKESQTDFLTFISYPHSLSRWGEAVVESDDYLHFQNLKRWISTAYYSSEIGLKELGWDGSFPHGQFNGCDAAGSHTSAHGDHLHDPNSPKA